MNRLTLPARAEDYARNTNKRVGDLARAASRIGDVIELINNIAGQTNLLALNATIEAARAGEAGRGFAVVASVVKALAEQTAKATGEISSQVEQIQQATRTSVDDIKQIVETIASMSRIAASISSAVEEQGAATAEISRNVQGAATGTLRSPRVSYMCARVPIETGTASAQVLSAARALAQNSTQLNQELEAFLGGIRRE
ncbi:methyl-accepting chemotaxis protein [Bradyrhizobium manausense]|uniref:methyl-accepting chemotaxis protein n=1 Tax=Bradyrhizobium manausense TaxID=989370 RepID=UPI001BACDEDD|nr:methyl-accepting chemotaxis protein [Bradyrhizobium manausense]MBR0725546.1 hypothetical protein [Bradyrhizobium manausense]